LLLDRHLLSSRTGLVAHLHEGVAGQGPRLRYATDTLGKQYLKGMISVRELYPPKQIAIGWEHPLGEPVPALIAKAMHAPLVMVGMRALRILFLTASQLFLSIGQPI
jgi:hypothetical protein